MRLDTDWAAGLWTAAFCVLLLSGLLVRFWLGRRQAQHILAHRDRVPDPFATHIRLADHQKAADYSLAKLQLGLWSQIVSSALLVGWTLLGGLNALDNQLLEAIGPGLLQQVLLIGLFMLINAVFDLPLEAWRLFRLEQRFGFNRLTPRLWLSDLLKATLLGTALGAPLLALVLWLMEGAGTFWWAWLWGLWVVFSVVMQVVVPTLIAPLFNRFQPLEAGPLHERVGQLMQRCGFRSRGLFVMDGSRRSAHANAYFTGFGPAKRVVFFDTLLQRLNTDEIEAVLAHELGHFRHRHVLQRTVLMLVLSATACALLGWLYGQSWFYLGLGVTPSVFSSPNALALILFSAVLPLGGFWLAPLWNRLSRAQEFQADAYASEHSSASHLAQALVKLYRDNASTLTPDPVFVRFHYSHPPASERLARLAT